MTKLEQCWRAIDEGSLTAFRAIADEIGETCLPEGPELAELAFDIIHGDDRDVALMSIVCFLTILERLNL
jgi:hypothetical protein